MAKKKKKEVVTTTAVINKIDVSCHKDNISFTSLNLAGEELEIISDMIKDDAGVRVTIDLENKTKEQEKLFPVIAVEGKLKSFTASKTCDAPKIDGIQFSSDQVSQITGYIRAETEIELTFTVVQPQLDLDNNPDGT